PAGAHQPRLHVSCPTRRPADLTPDPNAKEGRYDALLKAGDAISASAPCSRGRPTINRSHPFSIILSVPLRGTLSSSICLFFLIRDRKGIRRNYRHVRSSCAVCC